MGSINLNAQDKSSFTTYWDNGLKIESDNGDFKLKMGGRLQYDMMVMNQSDSLNSYFPNAYNGTEIRRARFYFSGKIYKNISYKVQIDFGTNLISVKDAYLAFHKIPIVGNLKVGKFKAPFGFNTLTSSKYLTMMERAQSSNFDDDRHLGLMLYRSHLNKRLTWQAGFFYPNDDNNKYQGNAYNLVGRIVGLPIYNTDDKNYNILHLGFAYSYQFHNNKTFTLKHRPEAHLAPKYSKFEIKHLHYINAFNIELVYIYKRFMFQSEYHDLVFQPTDGQTAINGSTKLGAYYGTLSFFLTDDHKAYSTSKTVFSKVNPKNNYGEEGWGAFEVAARYSHVDDSKQYTYGGAMDNIALGLNWYANPAVKVALNYVHSINHAYDGNADIFQMRFQVAF